MEHDIIREWEHVRHIDVGAFKRELLLKFAALIHEGNKRNNLTGLKTKEEILSKLILGSIEPILNFNVPRGTKFADIGTGAGIPGIPIAICFGDMTGVLIDSNNKKISFLKQVVRDLNLENVCPLLGRVEELGREQLRGAFNLVFSRAFGHALILAELSAPLLVQGGVLFIYSSDQVKDLPEKVIDNIQKFGMRVIESSAYCKYGLEEANLLMEKNGSTDLIYPRRMAAIKRNMKRLVQGTR